jgi:cytosine/adenosine deaminase-related metal-dependent hydrolase
MAQAGLTPLQAISVASKNGAQLLGVTDQHGTLEPGKKANFIVLDKDPSQDIHNESCADALLVAFLHQDMRTQCACRAVGGPADQAASHSSRDGKFRSTARP